MPGCRGSMRLLDISKVLFDVIVVIHYSIRHGDNETMKQSVRTLEDAIG